MNQKLKFLLSIIIGVLPLNITLIWYRLTQTAAFTTRDMLVYPLLYGGGNILLILILNRFLLKKKLRDFNPGKRKWYWDILAGIVLLIVFFVLLFAERAIIMPYLPSGRPPSSELINMITGLVRNPVQFAIWLGPVVWIGVASFEEIQRIFFMNCMWAFSVNKYWQWFSLVFVALAWGFMHLYQGPFGIISVSIQGLVMGYFYYKFRRIWPLIISHALYDSIQVILFAIQIS